MSLRREGKRNADRGTTGDRGDSGASQSAAALAKYEAIWTELASAKSAARYFGADPGRAVEKPPIATRQGDVPILAWKAARIEWGPGGGYSFRGVGHGTRYAADAIASCDRHRDFNRALAGMWDRRYEQAEPHEAPQVDCRCGFYAMRELPSVESDAHFLLTVELFGKVIVCEHGYRAQRQRVMQVAVPSQCMFCTDVPAWAVVPNGYTASEPCDLSPRCTQHVGPFDVPVEWAALSDALGCPIEVA